MPFIVECEGLKGSRLEKCMDYYKPIYQRNFPALGECIEEQDGNIECMKLYGATCPSDPPPPEGAKPRHIHKILYEKYIKPKCAPEISGIQRFLSKATDFLKG